MLVYGGSLICVKTLKSCKSLRFETIIATQIALKMVWTCDQGTPHDIEPMETIFIKFCFQYVSCMLIFWYTNSSFTWQMEKRQFPKHFSRHGSVFVPCTISTVVFSHECLLICKRIHSKNSNTTLGIHSQTLSWLHSCDKLYICTSHRKGLAMVIGNSRKRVEK